MAGGRLSARDQWMHLPPEVERLVPELVAECAGGQEEVEAERIETLLLAGSPSRWLDYLRELGRVVESLGGQSGRPPSVELARLAAIVRDQLVLIQSVLDLSADDLSLVRSLETLETAASGAAGGDLSRAADRR